MSDVADRAERKPARPARTQVNRLSPAARVLGTLISAVVGIQSAGGRVGGRPDHGPGAGTGDGPHTDPAEPSDTRPPARAA